MIIARTIAECRRERARLGELAFVPTMGALHAGHVSLMALGKRHAAKVAVSIFVNPAQFGPKEDFNKYPRPIEEDLAKCEAAGVDLIFLPTPEEMYPPGGPRMEIDLPDLASVLEGKHRPGHFRGVCWVVAKLFNIVRPEAAIFGQKDFQQLRILAAMVEAMEFPIRMVPGPILRDPDGLAMSSRNQYLSPAEREKALSISRGLFAAEAEFKKGARQSSRLVTTIQKILLEQHLAIDYVAAVDPIKLQYIEMVSGPTVFLCGRPRRGDAADR